MPGPRTVPRISLPKAKRDAIVSSSSTGGAFAVDVCLSSFISLLDAVANIARRSSKAHFRNIKGSK